MATEDSIVERDKAIHWFSPNKMLALVIPLMIACEVEAIDGLWFKDALQHYGLERYFLPILIALPAFSQFTFHLEIRRWVAHGKIASGSAARVIMTFGMVLAVAYICILELAGLAFSAR
jgi:hypothetical protein